MVDFGKRLQKKKTSKPTDPIELYDSLDRESDKGPLRPVQETVLRSWDLERRSGKDVILKLHTGQGKTLIGLVILQSKLNEGKGPALYLCPSNYLVGQTATQARQFGITAVQAVGGADIPTAFINGDAILITSVHKVFNGKSKFGIGLKGVDVGSIVMDDCHACIDTLKEQLLIRLSRSDPPYDDLLNLFGSDLERQRLGTHTDIRSGSYEALLPVPYWAWADKLGDVTALLSKHAASKPLQFVWPLLKDLLAHCQCLISGQAIEIVPFLPPLDQFPSYAQAGHRVFMSATVTDDSFLVKGLGLAPATVTTPLVDPNETWSGEKMILIPSLIDEALDREDVIEAFTPQIKKASPFGVAALTPSFAVSRDWGHRGASVVKTDTIDSTVDQLRRGKIDKTVVFANRYDGVDLPDAACRILILDGLPQGETLLDRYYEQCRAGSDSVAVRLTRIIEQGLGRSVRGEKDYCAIVLIGTDLVRHVQTGSTRNDFSDQTRAQIEIGLEIAQIALEDLEAGRKPQNVLFGLITQLLNRDSAWKAFYVEKMDGMTRASRKSNVLDLFQREMKAEILAQDGRPEEAVAVVQGLIDSYAPEKPERGWYLQEMARYTWMFNKKAAETLQSAAHSNNRYLLKPRTGVSVQRMAVVSQGRMERILAWVSAHTDFAEMMIVLEDMLAFLQFGTKAERFKAAMQDLGTALGFTSERPDREWGEGPDNLWSIGTNEYLLWECKSEVKTERELIHKAETGQMNNACAWLQREYGDVTFHPRLIIPVAECGPGAAFSESVQIVKQKDLKQLQSAVRRCFLELKSMNLKDIPEATMQQLIDGNGLGNADLIARTHLIKP